MTTTIKVYMAGPMTGYVDHNYPAFHRAEGILHGDGFEPVNPARSFDGRTDLPWSTYIKSALGQILGCDQLLLLPGWEDSKGALLEKQVAEAIGLKVFLPGAYGPVMRDAAEAGELQGKKLEPVGLSDEQLRFLAQEVHSTGEAFAKATGGPLNPGYALPPKKSVLAEADELINGDRQKDYGRPSVNLGRIAKIWSGLLDIDVTPQQVALCMVGVKAARHVHFPKRDNIVDLAGYAGLLELLDGE